MQRIIRNTLATLSALLILTIAPASAATQVPFGASFDGTLAVTGVSNGGPSAAAYSGPGMGSRLGAGRMDGNIAVLGPACGANGGFVARHTDTLTAANGDKITLQVDETACGTGTQGRYHCVGTYTVVGGTGRFAGATGSGTFDGVVTFTSQMQGVFHATYSGTISVSL